MQNGVAFTGGMSPKSTFEIDLALQKLGCRGKCGTVFEKKEFSTQTPFRTSRATRSNKQMASYFWAQIMDFALKT